MLDNLKEGGCFSSFPESLTDLVVSWCIFCVCRGVDYWSSVQCYLTKMSSLTTL